jgi:hypothetical protein
MLHSLVILNIVFCQFAHWFWTCYAFSCDELWAYLEICEFGNLIFIGGAKFVYFIMFGLVWFEPGLPSSEFLVVQYGIKLECWKFAMQKT